MMKAYRTALAALILLAGFAATANAQDRSNRFQVYVGGGWHSFADGSAVESGATVGSELSYFLTQNLGIGVWTNYTFTETDGSKFPPATLSFVDSTTFTTVSQPLDIWEVGAHGKFQFGRGGLAPYLLAGAGLYTLFLDPQQVDSHRTESGFMLRFGAGIDFTLSSAAGLHLSVSDAFFPNWEPNRLFPVEEEFVNSRFPELNPDPDDLDDSVHNFRFTAAIAVTPGG